MTTVYNLENVAAFDKPQKLALWAVNGVIALTFLAACSEPVKPNVALTDTRVAQLEEVFNKVLPTDTVMSLQESKCEIPLMIRLDTGHWSDSWCAERYEHLMGLFDFPTDIGLKLE